MASDGKVQASIREGVPDIYDVMLNRVLMFAAGATVELPIGFLPKPTITFQLSPLYLVPTRLPILFIYLLSTRNVSSLRTTFCIAYSMMQVWAKSKWLY